MLLRWYKGTCKVKASLRRASTDFSLFWFPRGNTQIAGARNTNWRSSHRNVFNSSLFHYIREPNTRPECWIFWRWPDATYRVPLFLSIPDYPSPIHSLIQASTNLSQHLWTRCSLHVAPRFKNTTVCDSVWNCCTPSQYSNARVREKASQGEVRTSQKSKSGTHSRSPRTSPSQIIKRYRLMMTFSPEVTGPRTIRAVCWNT